MSGQLDIHGDEQPLTWDGEPLYSVETVAEGLFDPGAFKQMPGQMTIPENACCDCGTRLDNPNVVSCPGGCAPFSGAS